MMPNNTSDVRTSQKQADNAYLKATVGVKQLSAQIARRQQEFFEPYGVTSTQFNVLRILRSLYPKPCNLIVIRDKIVGNNSDVSRLVERLRKAGFIERVINNDDRRSVNVTITLKGLNLLSEVGDKMDEQWTLPKISQQEADELARLIDKTLE